MAADKFRFNEIPIAGERMLLVSGQVTHAARFTTEGGQPATPSSSYGKHDARQDLHDQFPLGSPIWAPRTLCGREWFHMAATAHVPDCKLCLRIIGGLLDSTDPDERINLICRLAMEKVIAISEARIEHVPGDQTEHLRKALRTALRQRKLTGRTYAHPTVMGVTVTVTSTAAYNAIPEEVNHARMMRVIERMSAGLSGEEPEPIPEEESAWIDWGLWGTN